MMMSMKNLIAFGKAVRIGAVMTDIERPTPITDVEKRVDSVISDLLGRKVSEPYRKQLGEALDTANKPIAGRPAGDAAIGRISKSGWEGFICRTEF